MNKHNEFPKISNIIDSRKEYDNMIIDNQNLKKRKFDDYSEDINVPIKKLKENMIINCHNYNTRSKTNPDKMIVNYYNNNRRGSNNNNRGRGRNNNRSGGRKRDDSSDSDTDSDYEDNNNNRRVPPKKPSTIVFMINPDAPPNRPVIPTPPPPPPVNPCPGRFCDHDDISLDMREIPDRLENASPDYKLNLQDLIELGLCYHCKCQTKFRTISLERLAKLATSLEKLDKTIGMHGIKENFIEQIIYFLLDLEPNPAELLHTILQGPPGVGKSYIIDILAEIYLNMGYLTKNVVKKVKLTDLKGKYVGHTPALTQQAINEAMGGILIIDEAYSLAGAEKADVFSSELIDTINRNMTENAGKFILVIAGYSDELDKRLFAHNPGLRSRFRFTFAINTYTASELMEIFNLKVAQDGWKYDESVNPEECLAFFTENYNTFKYFGRDMETLLFHSKVSHANRVFFKDTNVKGKLTMEDIKSGYKRFFQHNAIKFDSKQIPISLRHMYI
jgi:hypothetical protein